jgi:UDP-glucose 4-epimerase
MRNNMRILITGVAGFIGSNLCSKLLSLGHSVIGIDNMSHGFQRNIDIFVQNPNFTYVNADIINPLILKDHKADILVHLASQKIPRYSNALRTLDENYHMLKNVVNKCLIDRIKLVFSSTSDVYGKNTVCPFTEDSDLVLGQTTIKRWAYALSKIYGEQYIMANNEEYDLPYTITRFFGSYGPHQNLTWWGGPQSVFITKALEGGEIEIHGDGLQTRTFTYIDDTVDALTRCILEEEAKNEIFNVGSMPEEEISIVGLATLIWKMINGEGANPRLKFIPYSTFGKYEDVMRRVPDISKIKSTLGYSPQFSLQDGLSRTIKWQKKLLGYN